MKQNKYIFVALIGVLIIFLFSGCAPMLTGYGKIRPQPSRVERISIEQLEQNWQDYTISYNGWKVSNPKGIMFDPKNNETTLVGDTWIKVEDKKTVSEIIGWIKNYTAFNPQVWTILGPDDRLYGYLFYPGGQVVIKVVNDTTMSVYSPSFPVRSKY
jgi:hypothetical protein